MKTLTKMYLFKSDVSSRKFDGLSFPDKSPVQGTINLGDDFFPQDCRQNGLNWTPPSLGNVWVPRKVVGNSRSYHDFPHALEAPILSRAAFDLLKDFLDSRCEILPLISERGEYFALNVQAKVDLLDVERSQIAWLDTEERVFSRVIESYAVDEKKLRENPIFRIPQDFISIYVNQDFVDRVNSSSLKGFYAEQVYPSCDGAFEINEDISNSVVLRFGFPNETQNRTAISAIKRYGKQLETILENNSSELIGSFEESEYLESEGRIYLSCPDRSVLGKVVESWAKKLRFDGEIEMVLRDGHYEDPDATETTIRLR